MPIDKERAKKMYNMVAENRKIRNLCGEGAPDDYFEKLGEYFYPEKLQSKGIEPDKSTQDMLDMLESFRLHLSVLQVAGRDKILNDPVDGEEKNDDGKEKKESPLESGGKGLTESQTMKMQEDMEKLFTGDPSPEQIMENYLRDHGNKHLASDELQFVSALVGAMSGINDILDRENSIEGLDSRESGFKEIRENIVSISNTKKETEEAAINAGIADVSSDGLQEFKDQIEEESKQLEQDSKELTEQLKKLQEEAKSIPGKDRYQSLKNDIANEWEQREHHWNRWRKLNKAVIEAKNSASKAGFEKLAEEYATLSEQRDAAKKEYDDIKERVDKAEGERDKRLDELEADAEKLKTQDEDLEHKIDEVNYRPADLMEMLTGFKNLQEQFVDTKRMTSLGYEADHMDAADVLEKMENIPKERLIKDGSEMQKYVIAKESILQAFGAYDENGNRAVELFTDMEENNFDPETVETFRKEVMDKFIPQRQKEIEQRIGELKNDVNVAKYLDIQKEKKELEDQNKLDREERGKARTKYNKLDSQARDKTRKYNQVSTTLCTAFGMTKAEQELYSNPKNWNSLLDHAKEKCTKEKEAFEQCKDRVEKGEELLQKEEKLFNETKSKVEKNTREQIEAGEKLRKVTEKQGELAQKKHAWNEVSFAKKYLKINLELAYGPEITNCQNAAETYAGHFAADRISAQLAKLSNELNVSKRGSNSDEYTQLKNTLEEAQRVFSGKEEDWWKKSAEQQKARQQDILDRLGQKAQHYLSEKEKQPHWWPFASVSGFKRREAAENILGYTKTASDIVQNTKAVEYDICRRIEGCKNPDGTWIDNYKEKIVNAKLNEFEQNIKQGIQIKELGKEKKKAPELAENNAPVKKKEGMALGK